MNEEIRRNTEITTEVLDLEEARSRGAMALFGEKYSEKVRVLTMGDGFSIELCGGTHASRTGDIGLFQIVNQTGVASGVRRIEAVTGGHAIDYVDDLETTVNQAQALLRSDRGGLIVKLGQLLDANKQLEKQVNELNSKLASGAGGDLADAAVDLGGAKLLVERMEGANAKSLPDALDRLKNKLGSGVVVLATVNGERVGLIAGVTQDLTDRISAAELVNHVAAQVGGKGGGRPDMAQAGGSDVAALPAALDSVRAFVEQHLNDSD